MKPRALTWSLLPVLALAGCFGDGGGPSQDGDDDGDTGGDGGGLLPGGGGDGGAGDGAPARIELLVDFAFDQCQGVHFYQEGDHAAVQARMPEGYTATRVAGDLDAAPKAYLFVDLYVCATFTTSNVLINDTWYGSAYTRIDALTSLHPDVTADQYEYVFQMLAGEDIMAQLWPAAGYPTYNGSTNHTVVTDIPSVVQLNFELGEYHLWSTGAAQTGANGGSVARFAETEAGTLVWTGKISRASTHAGQSQFDLPEESPWYGFGPAEDNRLVGAFTYSPAASFAENRLVLEPLQNA